MGRQTMRLNGAYHIRAKVYKNTKKYDEPQIKTNSSILIYCRYTSPVSITWDISADGIRREKKQCSIETIDLKRDEVSVGDYVQLDDERYTITSITYPQMEIQNGVMRTPTVKTMLSLG